MTERDEASVGEPADLVYLEGLPPELVDAMQLGLLQGVTSVVASEQLGLLQGATSFVASGQLAQVYRVVGEPLAQSRGGGCASSDAERCVRCICDSPTREAEGSERSAPDASGSVVAGVTALRQAHGHVDDDAARAGAGEGLRDPTQGSSEGETYGLSARDPKSLAPILDTRIDHRNALIQ